MTTMRTMTTMPNLRTQNLTSLRPHLFSTRSQKLNPLRLSLSPQIENLFRNKIPKFFSHPQLIFRALFTFLVFSVLSTISSANAAPIKVGLILDKGGKEDKSFNSAAFLGAQNAQKEWGIDLKVVEATDDNSFEPLIRAFAKRNFDLIICVGFSQSDSLTKMAPQFPKVHFAIVDSHVDFPNVASLIFKEHQGSFLVGALAALKSKSGKIGFMGGMDIPLIRRFQMGYEAGARYINPKIKITSNFLGFTADAWNNPPKAKELSMGQYNAGVDVIFAAAGASNMGLFDAAEEKKKLAIGVDSNQNWIRPGFVLTSMLKRVDVAVYDVVTKAHKNTFKGGSFHFGLDNQGIDYAMDQHNKSLITEDLIKKLESIKKDIVAGKIVVPDYYLVNKTKK